MRLLLDGYWLRGGPPSGRSVVHAVLTNWNNIHTDDLTVAVPTNLGVKDLPPETSRLPLRLRPHSLAVAVEMSGGRQYDAALTQNFTPLHFRGVRATFVHDLIYRDHPEWFTAAERVYLRQIDQGLTRADVVLTSSNAERERIERIHPALKARTRAVGLALPRDLTSVRPQPVANLSAGSFILCVGRLNVRKNVEGLASAIVEGGIVGNGLRLVIVGARNGRFRSRALDVSENILQLGAVGDQELAWLYQNCALFCFPSLDEGFGLPILEAAAFGARMALSDIPAFREVAPKARFFDPRSPESMTSVVSAALSGPQIDSPLARAYTWPSVVRELRLALGEAVQ